MPGLLLGRYAAVYDGLQDGVWVLADLIRDCEYPSDAESS